MRDADFSKFAGYDLVIGGSPCTFWSIAKTGREVDKDGIGWMLFMGFVEAVRIIKPRFFLYENVASMPPNIKTFISDELGFEPVLINSALVSAQQRRRFVMDTVLSFEFARNPDIKNGIKSAKPLCFQGFLDLSLL